MIRIETSKTKDGNIDRMPKNRTATSINLNPDQRAQLERLWFTYGNYGSKRTPGNHSFIQGLLEHGLDLRPLFTKRTSKAEKPTSECEVAVDAVLARESNLKGEAPRHTTGNELRVVRAQAHERPPVVVDQEVKELLDGMKRRNPKMGISLEVEDDTPDAA